MFAKDIQVWAKKKVRELIRTRRLGRLEPIILSRSFDVWQRYSIITTSVQPTLTSHEGGISVVEIGVGGTGLYNWLPFSDGDFVGVDVDKKRLLMSDLKFQRILASGNALPFKPCSVKIVVASAMLEHISRIDRKKVAEEFKRIARQAVVVYAPVGFSGKHFDAKFAKTFKRLFKKDDPPTKEHLQFGEPTLNELAELFPNCSLKLFQNGVIWYVLMVLARLRVIGWITGILYVTILSRFDKNPPFYGCMLTWYK